MEAPVEHAPISYSWMDVWEKVLFHPSVQSFLDILADPKAGQSRAFVWVAITGAVTGLVQGFQQMNNAQFGAFGLICGLIAGPIGAVIGLGIGSAIIHALAGLFGGRGTFDKMVYAMAAITAPSSLVSAIISLVSLIITSLASSGTALAGAGLLGLCIMPLALAWGIYAIVLEVNAIRAVEGVSTGQAVLILFIPAIVLLILFGVCMALGLGAYLSNNPLTK